MSARTKISDRLQEVVGLKADQASGQLCGVYHGYHVRLVPYNGSNAYSYMACFSLSQGGMQPRKEDIREIVKGSKVFYGRAQVKGFSVSFPLRAKLTLGKSVENIRTALDYITEQLGIRGYRECCESCGRETMTEHYRMGNQFLLLCPDCYSTKAGEITTRNQRDSLKEETVVGGVIGALLGSLIGAASIVLLGQLGYVSMLSGIIMGFCVLKGYRLLGNRISRKGIVISLAVIALMVYAANRLDWAISFSKWTGGEVDILTAFRYFTDIMKEGYINLKSYWMDLGLVYLFSALGAIPAIVNIVKSDRNASSFEQMGGKDTF